MKCSACRREDPRGARFRGARLVVARVIRGRREPVHGLQDSFQGRCKWLATALMGQRPAAIS